MKKTENVARRKMLIHHFIEEVRDEDLEEILCATVTRLMVRAHGMHENEGLKLEVAIDHLLSAEAIIREVDSAEEEKEKESKTIWVKETSDVPQEE